MALPTGSRRRIGIALLVLAIAAFLTSLTSATGGDGLAPEQSKSTWSRLRGTHFNTFRRPLGTSSDLYAVDAFPDSQRVWVGGSGGVLAFSENDGQSVDRARVMGAQGMRPIQYVNQVNVQPLAGYSETILDLYFENAVHGYAVDGAGGILETFSGGHTWTRYDSPESPPLRTVGAVRPDHFTGGVVQVSSQEIVGFPLLRAQAAQRRFSAAHWYGPDAALGISGDSVLLGIGGPAGTWSPVPLPPASGDLPGAQRVVALARLGPASALVAVELPQRRTRILRGQLSGSTWSWSVVSELAFQVAALRAAGPAHVWALTAADARVLRSTDGGAAWTALPLAPGLGLRDLTFRDATRGWAVGDDGTILRTADGGETWAALSGAGDRLEAVRFVGPRKGWAVGSWGTVLYTGDGGRSWAGRGGASRARLHDLAALSVNEVVAVGDRLTVLRTTDGGRSWQNAEVGASRGPAHLRALHFPTVRAGWAVGDSGTILRSTDGGQNWTESRLLSRENLTDVFFSDAERGWITSEPGRIYTTANGGLSWEVERDSALPLRSIHGAGGAVWTVGAGGTVLLRAAEGTWTSVPSGTDADLEAVVLATRDSGWTAGSDGTLLQSTDGGRTWRRTPSGTGADLLAINVEARGGVWAVGAAGAVLHRDRGTGAWRPLATERHWFPGALFAIGVLTAAGAVFLIALAPVERRVDNRTIDAVLVSDEPLQPGDPGAERLTRYARTIARFLLNRSTRPPLTLAITGRWGAGKSTLMNLIRGQVRAYGRQPVQFNAWQHQKEDHLLAAFLETIRSEALPTLFVSPIRWVVFRSRLLWIRMGAHRPAATAALIFLGLSTAFLILPLAIGWPDSLADRFDSCTNLNACAKDLWETILANLVASLSMAAFLVLLVQSVRSFGALPTSLFAKLGEMIRIKPAALETSIRQRFAAELQEVSQALSEDHPLIVFVDDLDRCRPKHILDVLEAIHFLVNAGKCMVVIGMDWERVVRSVALGFGEDAETIWLPEDVEATPGAPVSRPLLTRADEAEPAAARAAEPEPAGAHAGDAPHAAAVMALAQLAAAKAAETNAAAAKAAAAASNRDRRVEYATQYLDKLITVTIPLPPPQPHDFAEYLRTATTTVRPERKRLAWKSALVPASVAFLVFVGAAGLVLSLTNELAAPGGTTVIAASAPAPGVGAGAVPAADTVSVAVEPQRQLPIYTQTRTDSPIWPFAVTALVVLLLGGAAALRAFRRKPEVIRDSEAFREAFRICAPYLAQKYRTPRALKKFVTRVRYYAMASAADAEFEAPPLAGEGGASPSTAREPVRDELLVALAVLHARDANAFQSEETYGTFAQTVGDTLGLDAASRVSLGLPDRLPPEWRDWFQNIVNGLQVESPGSGEDVSVQGKEAGTQASR